MWGLVSTFKAVLKFSFLFIHQETWSWSWIVWIGIQIFCGIAFKCLQTFLNSSPKMPSVCLQESGAPTWQQWGPADAASARWLCSVCAGSRQLCCLGWPWPGAHPSPAAAACSPEPRWSPPGSPGTETTSGLTQEAGASMAHGAGDRIFNRIFQEKKRFAPKIWFTKL